MPPFVGIHALPELDLERCPAEFERVAEEMFQITPISFGHLFQTTAVNNDPRRVTAALMGITHFGPEHAKAGWRLLGHGGHQGARQLGGGEFGHGRLIGAFYRNE